MYIVEKYITTLIYEVSSFSINHVQSSFCKPITNIILLSFFTWSTSLEAFAVYFCLCCRGDAVPWPSALSTRRRILSHCNDVYVIIVDF